MTPPLAAAQRFGAACLLGLGLGLWYGFLRPLRAGHRQLSDLLFVPALFWAWLYLGFGICGGDLRLFYTAGLFVGLWGWEATFGRLLRPVFSMFWKIIRGGLHKIWGTSKNF